MITSTNKKESAKVSFAVLLALYFSLAVIAVFTHNLIVDRPFHAQCVELHKQVIAGIAPAPIQYRIFVYYIAEGLMRLGLSFDWSYWLIRWFFVFAGALLFHLYLRKWFEDGVCLAGTLFMFAVLPLTYWGYFMQPTDPANFVFFLLAYWLIRDRKDALLAPLLFVATFNREAPVILPLVFLIYRYDELPASELIGKFLLFCFSTGIVYFGLPRIMGVRNAYEEIFVFARNIRDYRAFLYPALLLSVFIILPWKDFARQPKFLKRSALMIPFFLVLHYLITLPRETRLFLPLLPIIVPMGLGVMFGRKEIDSAEPAVQSPGKLQRLVIEHPKITYAVLFVFFLAAFRVYYIHMEKTYMKSFYSSREAAALVMEGNALLKRGDYAGAVHALEDALLKDPRSEDANLTLGIIYGYNMKDAAKAVFHFRRILEINPNNPQAEKIRQEISHLENR
jgi:tetratricopeptide (TPR) repeat protein